MEKKAAVWSTRRDQLQRAEGRLYPMEGLDKREGAYQYIREMDCCESVPKLEIQLLLKHIKL